MLSQLQAGFPGRCNRQLRYDFRLPRMTTRQYRALSILVCLLFVLVVYGWHTGRMIYSDDFSRIQDNSSLNADYFKKLMVDNKSDGFYRPLNHLTFGLTYYLFGIDARAYGYFNLAILMGTCWVLYQVVERLTSSTVFASLTVFGWLLNVKLVSATLLWAVGRCDGMYALFLLVASLLSLKAVGSSRCYIYLCLSALSVFLAMLAKENAIVGPILAMAIFLGASIRRRQFRLKPLLYFGIWMAFFTAVYLILRAHSGAMTPHDAPSYYRLHWSLPVVMSHIRFYIDRSLILSALIVPAVALVFLAERARRRRRAGTTWAKVAAIVIAGMSMFLIAASPILALPRWGDLYGYFPSIFVVGMMVALLSQSRIWPAHRRDLPLLLASMIILSLAVAPIILAKGRREVEKNRYVYEWCRSVKAQLRGEDPVRVVMLKNPTEWAAAGLTDVDFTYFHMGVMLMLKKPVIVAVRNDQDEHGARGANDCIFEFMPDTAKGHIAPLYSTRGVWRRVSGT